MFLNLEINFKNTVGVIPYHTLHLPHKNAIQEWIIIKEWAMDRSLPHHRPVPHQLMLIKDTQVAQPWIRLTWIFFQNSHCPEVLFQVEKLKDEVLSSFPVCIYWAWISYLISISTGWWMKTKLEEKLITTVAWILLHLKDSHKAVASLGDSLARGQAI